MRGLSVIILAGCTGGFGPPPKSQIKLPEINVATVSPAQRAAACAAGVVPSPAMPSLIRLSNAQYDGVMSDLLGQDVAPSAAFSADPSVGGFDNNVATLTVSTQLAKDYRTTAEAFATAITSDAPTFAAILQCQPSAGVTCATQFINRFAAKAYRRPISADETAAYVTLFNSAPAIFDSGDMFINGIRLVIEAALQSPNYVYRVAPQAPGVDETPLSDYQIAEQLGLMIWSGLPDDTLLAAAAAGALHTTDEVIAQTTRMLQSPRAQRTMDTFHAQLFAVGTFGSVQKDTTKFPAFTAGVIAAMREEVLRFSSYVVFGVGGTVQTLFTAPYTFVNAALAPLYGLSGSFGNDFSRVDLDPKTRAGLLTQIGFLASHAHEQDTSPILRGVFVYRDMMCAPLGNPPANIDRTITPASGAIVTERQRIEHTTSPAACASCHSLINPPGFVLEGFDAAGQVQTTDAGQAVDTHGSMLIDGVSTDFASPVELAQAVGASQQASRCYSTKLLRFMLQRQETAADFCAIDQLTTGLTSTDYSIKQAIVDLSATKSALIRGAGTAP